MQGVKETAVLPPALQVDPGTLSAEEQNARGIKPLASNLAEALSAFNADTGAQRGGPTYSVHRLYNLWRMHWSTCCNSTMTGIDVTF